MSTDRNRKYGALQIALVLIFLSLYVMPSMVCAGGNPSTQLHVPAGQSTPLTSGDYISTSTAQGGLQTYYSYFIEVTPGLSKLQIDIFDADVGFGDNINGPRDRQRGGTWNTTATYSLFDPTGAARPTRFTTGNNAGPAGSDNAWLTFYSGTGHYVRDDFTTSAYNNNDGNYNWATNWLETDSAVGGAGPGAGNIQITGGELRLTGTANNNYIEREVDLSPTGLNLTYAYLTFSYRTSNNLENNDCVSIQASNNGGTTWSPSLQTFCNDPGGPTLITQDISAYISNNTRIRFIITNGLEANEFFYVDYVEINDNSGGLLTPGHWEFRVDMGTGDDLNGFAIRAHDGDPASGGTEVNVYAHTFVEFGVNSATSGASVNYTLYPYITSGCFANSRDFDFDGCGSFAYTSRTGAYTFTNPGVSGSTVWLNTQVGNNPPLASWVTDTRSADYGIWSVAVNINSCPSSDTSNYGTYYLGAFDTETMPPAVDDQPEENSFRLYLPTDAGTAPVKPILTQTLSHISGQNPPGVGQTERVAVQITMFNPTLYPITFSNSNLVVANVPGTGAVYAGNATVSQGSITGQPGMGLTGNITWNPGTVAAGTFASLLYYVDVTPTSSGQRVGVTGSGASGTRATYVDETCSGASPACSGIQLARATHTWTYGHAYTGPSFGPLCPLVVTQGGNPIPTLAVISSFDAYEENGQVVVEWKTASEVGTVGFYLLRQDKETGKFKQINKRLLPGLINSRQGGTYRLVDHGASLSESVTYKLVEIESRGTQRTYGPFAFVNGISQNGLQSLKSVQRTALHKPEVLSEGTVSHYTRQSHQITDSQQNRLRTRQAEQKAVQSLQAAQVAQQAKIGISDSGLYHLAASNIASVLGIPEQRVKDMIKTNQLSLSNQGKRVAFIADGQNSGILFYGQEMDSVYTRKNIYWLSKEKGLEMGRVEGKGPEPVTTSEIFDDTLYFEEDHIDAPGLFKDPTADYWFWDYIVSGDPGMGTRTFSLRAHGVPSVENNASLTIRLFGATDASVMGEHHAIFTLNGEKIGETQWQGTVDHSVTLSFSQDLLHDGDNTLEMTGVLDQGVPYSIFFINSFDLSYQRLYQAVGNSLLFRGDANQVVTVSGFTTPDIMLFEITDPTSPKLIKATTIDGTSANYRVSFRPASADSVYLAVCGEGIKEGSDVWTDTPSSLKEKNNKADYLVITTSSLREAAQSLAAYRKGQQFATMVVDQENIMDEFNYGVFSPEAVRNFLSYAYRNWKRPPKYVVLAGDGTYDYKNNLGLGDSMIPPMMVGTPDGLFPSDNYLGAVDDRVPKMAIGRLPASTSQELQGIIKKIIEYDTAVGGSQGKRAVMLADIPEEGAPFTIESDQLASLLPLDYTTIRIYLSEHPLDEARWLFLNEMNKGTGFVNYFGHAGVDRFSQHGLLMIADVSSMTNKGKYPIVSAMTCVVGQFSIPGYDSLAEELLLKQDGGAMAVWAPTGISVDSEAAILDRAFFQHYFGEKTRLLGDAVLKSLEDYSREGSLPHMIDIYNLLGDPALRIRAN